MRDRCRERETQDENTEDKVSERMTEPTARQMEREHLSTPTSAHIVTTSEGSVKVTDSRPPSIENKAWIKPVAGAYRMKSW